MTLMPTGKEVSSDYHSKRFILGMSGWTKETRGNLYFLTTITEGITEGNQSKTFI